MLTMLLVAGAFRFAGGTPAELATGLAEAAGRPVVFASVSATTRLRAASFTWEKSGEVGERVRSYFLFDSAGSADLGFSPKAFPVAMVDPKSAERVEYANGVSVSEGKVTAKTEKGKAIYLSQVASAGWTKKLSIPACYKDVPIYAAAQSAPESDFLAALAAALGAKVGGDAFVVLEPIASVFKERLAGAHRAHALLAKTEFDSVKRSLAGAYVEESTPQQALDLFTGPGDASVYAPRNSRLYRGAWNLARIAAAQGLWPAPQGARRSVDMGRPVRLIYRAGQPLTVEFLDAQGRTAAVL